MSLFKVRDCWSTACGRGAETFGCDALAVDDLFGAGHDNVMVGSWDGVLRVYGVHAGPPPDLRYSPSDLLLEVQTASPVLQVCTGRLISYSSNKYIAVLHPFSIVVHGLNCIAGSTDHGDQYVLETMYEHKFERSAYQMVVGPFGGGSGSRDFVCVMSLDGAVSVYEQQVFGFRAALPNYLHPFPVKYVRSADAFVTLNADLCMVCYKYQELADSSLKQKWPVWSCTLGETVYDIQTVDITPSASTIHVLGERNYYCFQGNGVLWFMKRLQYAPRCFHPYIAGDESDPKTMCMIVSDTDTVLIYEQTKLRWSAKLPYHPCIISRASFKALRGCLVLLSETGDLRFCYLGTDPTIFMAPERPSKDHKDAKHQLVQLKKDLQNVSLRDEADTLPLLKLNARISSVRTEGSRKSCDIEIDVSPSLPTSRVQITFQTVAPLAVSPTVVHLTELNRRKETHLVVPAHSCCFGALELLSRIHLLSKTRVRRLLLADHSLHKMCHRQTVSTEQPSFYSLCPETVTVRATAQRENDGGDSDSDSAAVSSTECTVCAHYSTTASGSEDVVPGPVLLTARLPLSLAYDVHRSPVVADESTAAAAAAGWSAKVSVDESPVPLKSLFKEFVDSSASTESWCFRTVASSRQQCVWVTGLSAVRSYEIRSSGGAEHVNAILEEILLRHREYYKTKKCVLRCDKNEMPVAELYQTIEEHIVLKGRLETVQEEIASLCAQYRIIQKCLFNKLKENTVRSVSELTALIDDTHETLTDKMSEIVIVKQELKVKFTKLSSLAKLLVTMLGLCSKNDKMLGEFKETVVHFTENQNWEETVLQSLSYLVGNEIMLNVQNDDPARLVMSLRTLIDYVIQRITSVKEELPDKLTRENSRGAVSPILETEEDFYN